MSNFVEFKHKGILINCTKSYKDGKDIYQAVRFAWVLDRERANQYDFVFAMVDGKICDVFKVKEWSKVIDNNLNEFYQIPKNFERIAFEGKLADYEIRLAYIGKEVPENYRGRAVCRYIDPATGENEEVAEE